MKPSANTLSALENMQQVSTLGDVRRIIGNSLLALARKEISATDVVAMSKAVDSIANSLNAEISLARASMDLRERGGYLGEVVRMGTTLIGGDPGAEQGKD